MTTYYLWDGDLLMAEENSSGVVTHSYTWGPAGLISDRVGGVTRFFLYDAQGNTRLLMDANGIVLGRATYSAWGSVIYSTLPANCPFGWQGDEGAYTDPESGLVYLHNRYYAPALGRFLTRDPSGFAGGINLYAYCSGDPIDRHDPAGLAGSGNFGPYIGPGPAMPTNSDDTAPGDDVIPPGTNTASDIMFHPGQKAGSDRSNTANQMLNNFEFVLGGAAFGAAGDSVGLVTDGAIATADAAAASGEANFLACLGGNCFIAGTSVQMADGRTKPIEKIKTGDLVMSRNPRTGQTEAKAVVATETHQNSGTVTVTFSNGDEITSTPEHPYYVDGKGFVSAGQLAIGTSIVTRAGPVTQVTGIKSSPAAVRVYNFTVADDHTYFVGSHNGGEWVHNNCISLDANAVIQLLEGDAQTQAAILAAIGGRTPIVSITAAKEFLVKGDAELLRNFLASTGGRIGAAGDSATISSLMASGIKLKDARVVASAIREGVNVITRDEKLLKKLGGRGVKF